MTLRASHYEQGKPCLALPSGSRDFAVTSRAAGSANWTRFSGFEAPEGTFNSLAYIKNKGLLDLFFYNTTLFSCV